MSDSTGVMGRRWQAWPRTARTAAAIIVTASLALPVAASGSSQSNAQKALAYARCVRAHGVSKYPDPSSSNETTSGLPKVSLRQLGVSSSQFEAAQSACRQLLPTGGQSTPAESRQILNGMLSFARCMRAHGVQTWPDPTFVPPGERGPGAPPYTFDLLGIPGLDTHSFSRQVNTAINKCQHLIPPSAGGISVER